MSQGLLSEDYLGRSLLFGSGGGGQWVHDWSAYQPVYDLTGSLIAASANSWATVVDITGKGFFKWCRMSSQSSATANPAIRITVDGQPYTFSSSLLGSALQGNEVNFEIPFNLSLKVEGFNRDTSAGSLLCDHLYLLKQSTPDPKKVTLLQQSQRKMAYADITATTLTDVVNITGSGYLLGIKFLGYYVTAGSNIAGDVAIDGAQKMTNRVLFSPYTDAYKMSEIMGPIRFNSSLRVRSRVLATGVNALCMVFYSLD